MHGENIPQSKIDKENLPDLLIGDEYSLLRLKYQEDENQYLTTKTLRLSPDTETSLAPTISHLLQCQKTIFVLASDLHNRYSRPSWNEDKVQIKILKITPDLEVIAERIFWEEFQFRRQDVGVTTHEDYLLISVDGNLLVLDQDLVTRGEVNLDIGKNADHILVHEKIAYLLDDVISPLFILKADLRYPDQPKIVDKYLIKRINGQLTGQWIDPNLKRWYVIEKYGHRGGSGTNIRFFPMEGKIGELGCQSIEEHIHNLYNDRSPFSSGQTILAVTPKPPIWGITRDTYQKLYLTFLKPRNGISDYIELDNYVELRSLLSTDTPVEQNNNDGYWNHSADIKMAGNYLFTLFRSSYRQRHQEDSFHDLRLVVFQTEPDLRIVLNQKLCVNFNNPKLEILS